MSTWKANLPPKNPKEERLPKQVFFDDDVPTQDDFNKDLNASNVSPKPISFNYRGIALKHPIKFDRSNKNIKNKIFIRSKIREIEVHRTLYLLQKYLDFSHSLYHLFLFICYIIS